MATAVSIFGNDIQTASITTNNVEHEGLPTINAPVVAVAHANHSVIPYISYPDKQIVLTGRVRGTSVADCDANLKTFRSYFAAQSGNLDIGYNGGTLRYAVTVTSPGVQVTRPRGMSYADFTVTLTCTAAFGQDTATTPALTATARTSSSYSDVFSFTGTAPYQAPIFTITLNSRTYSGVTTTATINIANASTGQSIGVTQAYANGDILVVDTAASTPNVKLNGAIVEYTGAFPYFLPGSGTMTYSDTFATRNLDESVVYTARYF